ncbi:MAG: AAA family ATPase [Candidatus Dormiibacterota bacterium]
MTLLYADLAEPQETPTASSEDAGLVEETRRALYRIVREAAAGHQARNLGEGFIVVFDDTANAMRCAIEVQRGADAYNLTHDGAMAARVGLNAGPPIRDEEDFFSTPVMVVRRLCEAATPGQVLASENVTELAQGGDGFRFADIGEIELRGLTRPLRAFAVSPAAEAGAPQPAATGFRAASAETFVGREADLGQLGDLWSGAEGGKRRLVLVSGEPGMGKTALAMRLAEQVQAAGGTVLYGRCDQAALVPFAPFAEAIRAHIAGCSDLDLAKEVAPVGSELSRLLPELLERLPQVGPPPQLSPEEARYRLFDAVRKLLAAIAADRALLLVLDDLHWCDRGSLLLFGFITRELPTARLMILGTYRDNEVDRRHPLAAAIANVRRDAEVNRVHLGGLSLGDLEALVEEESGHGLDDVARTAVTAVQTATGGHPLYVREVLRHLGAEGRLRYEDGQWSSDVRAPGDIGVPEGVQEAIRIRLAHMSADCGATLPMAAVIGRDFSLATLGGIAGLQEERLIDVLEEAVEGHLIEESADVLGAFRFAHALIRDTLYDSLTQVRRTALHRSIAASLEAELATGEARPGSAAQVAHHLLASAAAGAEAKTAHFLELAGDDARDATAYEEALRFYEQALEVVGDVDDPARTQLMYQVGLAQRNLGDWEPALATWREAMDAARRTADTELTGRIAWSIANQFVWAGRYPECIEIAGMGLNALGEAETADRGHLLACLGSVFSLGGSYAIGEEMTGAALDMADRLGDQAFLGHALTFRCAHHIAFWQFEAAVAVADQAERLNRAENDQWSLANNLGLQYFTSIMGGRFDDAARVGAELRPLADHIKHHGAHLLLVRGDIARASMNGDLDGIQALARREIEVCEEAGFTWTDTPHVSLAHAAFWRGDWETALEEVKIAESMEQPSFAAGQAGGARFRLLAYMDRRDEAMELHRSLRHDIAEPDQPNAAGRWVALQRVVEGFWALGMYDEAAELLPAMEQALALGAIFNGFEGTILETTAGIGAAAARLWDKSEAHFASALKVAESTPHRIERADIRRFRAQALLLRGEDGDAQTAGALLVEAGDAYRKLGMPRHAAIVKELAEGI